MKYEYAVIGGDKRQVFLADELVAGGHNVICFGLDSDCKADKAAFWEIAAMAPKVICPVPIASEPSCFDSQITGTDITIRMLVNQLKPGQQLIAGCLGEPLITGLTAKNVSACDIMHNEKLAIYNSIATAEGAVCEAISGSPLNLCLSFCAVLGYGRCGRAIADRLDGMHCHTAIYSDDDAELAAATASGHDTYRLAELADNAGKYTFIFNTIPAMIITSDIIGRLGKDTLITDIASGGGTDFDAARLAGISAHLCAGLPGRYSPASSGIMLARIIESSI